MVDDGRTEAVEVAVVVVTHDSAPLLPELFASLRPGLDGVRSWRLIVADSGSADESVEVVRSLEPGATVVELNGNVGYAAGINAAVRAAPAHRAVLVLNPDIRLHAGCVRRLVDAMSPRVGVTAPRLLEVGGKLARSLRRDPTLMRAIGEATLGGSRAGLLGIGEIVGDPTQYEGSGTIDWATGAAWLVQQACFRAVGGFDEEFFLYSEETDFARRARACGYEIRYISDATATHVGGRSNVDSALYALLTRNRVVCYRRWHGPIATFAFRSVVLAGELVRAATRRPSRAATLALCGNQAVLPDAYRVLRNPGHRGGRSLSASLSRRSDA